MGWQSEEFGSSHEGAPGPLLADGSEPKPVYLDPGSGGHMHQTSEWWAYDGKVSGQRAAHVHDDWTWHIAEVAARSVPLPSEVEDLLVRLENQMEALADGGPLAGTALGLTEKEARARLIRHRLGR